MVSSESYDELEYSTIASLYDIRKIGETVKVRVMITWVRVPIISHGELSTYIICQSPEGGQFPGQIFSTEVRGEGLIRKLVGMTQPTQLADVQGEVATMLNSQGEEGFRLSIHDVQPVQTALELVCANHREVEQVEAKLAQLKEKSMDVHEYLRSTLIEKIGIRGMENMFELSDSLDFIILQAASDGWLNNRDSGKLHSLIIGAPATGKKLLIEAIKALNPVYQEARGGKLTVAGICGTAYNKGGEWRSKPGYVPLANGGVFSIQDFHHVKASQRDKTLDTLALVMEDGKVIDSTSARQVHHALTAIHLDTNKQSDLFPETKAGRSLQKDIKIAMHLLSRFDFVIDIERDPERQKAIALAMYESGATVGPQHPEITRDTWERDSRVMVAYLRQKHIAVDLESANSYMRQRHEQLMVGVEELFESVPGILSDFQTRTVNTVRKMVAACARLGDRDAAVPEDVDLTFRLLARKFDFVSSLMASYAASFIHGNAQLLRGERLDTWLLETFAGERVKRSEILEKVHQLASPPSNRSVERRLASLGLQTEHGYYEFPDIHSETLSDKSELAAVVIKSG